MSERRTTQTSALSLAERFMILGLYVALLFVVHRFVSSTWIPSSGIQDLWLVSAVGALTFDLLSAPFFVKPKDSLASCITTLLLLWSLDLSLQHDLPPAINTFRWVSFIAISIIMVFSVLAIFFYKKPDREALSRITYYIATSGDHFHRSGIN